MRRAGGFTLLEMLVALVVFGLVMAGLTQTFRFGLTAWSAANRNIAGTEDLAAVDAALSGIIAQARPGSLTGQANQLALTSRLPPGAGLGDALADIALRLDAGDLVIRYAPHPPGIPLGPPPAPSLAVVARGVAGLTLEYLVARPGGPAVWTNIWQGNGLPLLIRIHCRFADARDWPDLVAAPVDTGN